MVIILIAWQKLTRWVLGTSTYKKSVIRFEGRKDDNV